MDSVERKVLEWCRKQAFSTRKEGTCVRMSLHQIVPPGKSGPEIARIAVGQQTLDAVGETLSNIHAEGYARELYTEATTYAEGIGETQTFVLHAYFSDDEEKVIARHAFRVNVEGDDISGIVDSEPASMTGVLRMQMRHNEALARTLAQSFGTVLGSQQRHIERQSSMLEKLWTDKVDNLEVIEQVLTQSHERAVMLRREETNAKIKEDAAGSVMALLPAIANKIIGKKILPETTDITLQQVIKLAENLTEEEFTGMLAALPPSKKIALVELMRSVDERTSKPATDVEDAPLAPRKLSAVKKGGER